MYTQSHTKGGKRIIAFVLLIALIGGYFFMRSDGASSQKMTTETKKEIITPETSSEFGIAVSGVVEARTAITVRAQSAGVVTHIAAREGSVVTRGAQLLTSDVPLLASRALLQDAQNDLALLGQDAQRIAQEGAATQARISNDAASTSVGLVAESVRTSSESGDSLLATQLYGSLTGLVATLDFIDANESYFPGTSLKEFRRTIDALYGSSPSYLSGGVQYAFHSHTDILAYLEETTKDTSYPEGATLVTIAELLDRELDATRTVLINGERDFLDTKKVSRTSALYSEYLAQRASIVEAQATLRVQLAAARGAHVGGNLQSLDATTNALLGVSGYATAAHMADVARAASLQTGVVGNAALGVLGAEGALGAPRAPFSGTVGKVFVDEGAYVMPGEPLMTLVGDGARELTVQVGGDMLPYLAVGNAFRVGEKTVGYVDRFTPMVVDGTVTVVIGLTEGAYIPGTTLRGEIVSTAGESDALALPRAYVHFDNVGAFVRTESDMLVRVSVLYDTGTMLVVRPEEMITEGITKAVGITL